MYLSLPFNTMVALDVITGRQLRRYEHKRRTGACLWQYNCGAGVNAPPISYAVNGVHYIAVAAGGNALFGYPEGDAVYAFALPS